MRPCSGTYIIHVNDVHIYESWMEYFFDGDAKDLEYLADRLKEKYEKKVKASLVKPDQQHLLLRDNLKDLSFKKASELQLNHSEIGGSKI